MAKTIDIEIKAGKLKVDLNGFQGHGCDAITNAFACLMAKVEKVEHKPEWKEHQKHVNTQHK